MRRCRHGENNAHPACNPYTGKAGLFTLSAVRNASLYEWDNLIPKAFWRGNDFWFLGVGYKDRKPASAFYLHRVLKEPSLRRRVGLMRAYLNPPGGGERKIGPRTAAVFQSLLDPDLVDAAFFDWGKYTSAEERAKDGELMGADVLERADEEYTARYKYLLDVGGGGGTTFTGTIAKVRPIHWFPYDPVGVVNAVS